jgi:hypothetical protein
MDFKLVLVIASAIALIFAMMIFRPIPLELFCESDADCVPEQPCHPTSCINVESQVRQELSYCTEECQPATLDCGQGSCQCVNNQCKAVMVDG